MADRIIKGDSGNDVIIQNNDASRKIEVTNSGDVEVTGDFKTTTMKATNLKANDGTASLEIADSTGDVGFSGNTDLKIKLPSAGGIYESDGSTEILKEASGSVSLKNVAVDSSVTMSANQSAVKTAINASGSAPIFAVRAFVNFNGTGTMTGSSVRSSGNVSSVTRVTGQGQYLIQFTTALADANYSAVMYNSASTGTGYANFANDYAGGLGNRSTTQLQIYTFSSAAVDSELVDLIIVA